MRQMCVTAFILTIAASFPAGAYTQEDVNACTPDALRLCQHAIPSESRVTQCLIENKSQLSPACTLVFDRSRAANASRERPARVPTKF